MVLSWLSIAHCCAIAIEITIHDLCSVTVAVLEPRFCLSSSPVRGKECLCVWPSVSSWPISCPVDGTTGYTDCVFCLSSPLPPDWKTAHHISWITERKTEEWQWQILIQSLLAMVTKPVRHFRCQLSDTRPPAVINSSWLLTHGPPVLLIEDCALCSQCTLSPLG